eukprot:TRINITY_DN17150_c0_g2_i1.p1 TRINITY_DN17150_c0_g2~~TRINITY_DN17150_c0_g2_i1.p1  ORF type:complete len:348 (+),score=37.13 TRINITY_DN17150_c0_g2_i1:58-1101(+)
MHKFYHEKFNRATNEFCEGLFSKTVQLQMSHIKKQRPVLTNSKEDAEADKDLQVAIIGKRSLSKPGKMRRSENNLKNPRMHLSRGALHVRDGANERFNQNAMQGLKKSCKNNYGERYSKRLTLIKRRCESKVQLKEFSKSPKRKDIKPNTSYSKVRSKLDETSYNKSFKTAMQNYWRYASPFKGEYKVINKRIMWKPSIDPTITYFFLKAQKKYNDSITKDKVEVRSTKHQSKLSPKNLLPHSRISLNYGFGSRPGQSNNIPKANQDCMIACPRLCNKDIHFFAVADGHGPFGRKVAETITNSLKCKVWIRNRQFGKIGEGAGRGGDEKRVLDGEQRVGGDDDRYEV